MSWLINMFTSSIGKKLLMAVTGLSFCGFLTVHLIGNLTLYGGKGLFNSYAEHLHSSGPLVTLFELGLLSFFLVHVLTGAILVYQNWKARPVKYFKKKKAGGRTIGSSTMPYSGFVLVIFVIIHLLNFHFIEKSVDRTIYDIVAEAFTQPHYIFFYFISMIIVAIHVSHGFWSAFQTIGASHPKYTPIIKVVGTGFSIIVGIGFGSIPLFISL